LIFARARLSLSILRTLSTYNTGYEQIDQVPTVMVMLCGGDRYLVDVNSNTWRALSEPAGTVHDAYDLFFYLNGSQGNSAPDPPTAQAAFTQTAIATFNLFVAGWQVALG
jgi:hypothetical protein